MQNYKKNINIMENQAKEEKKEGFEVGIKAAYKKCTAAQYDQLLHDLTEVCMSTEARGVSRSSYYNKRYGRTPLTKAEEESITKIFWRYGITNWRGGLQS